ncbi:thermostable hemolysin [uncultured Hydrogenophaga sp.]|uniref:thermostable hemolysin n=1 Tax=uncultured Hydrogenophaga sp. TaxID=199683 RepID=UPI0025883687|nr:thermostable hemolysin [uncultured Hydrogenophaga sp.]
MNTQISYPAGATSVCGGPGAPGEAPRGPLVLRPLVGAARDRGLDLIRRRFQQEHQAQLTHFMPRLLGLLDAAGALAGAAGCRPAASETLFLERYVDLPIEQAIAAVAGEPVARHEVVEVGNLAATSPGCARVLIVALTDWLAGQGYRWVAFTGTRSLLNSFRRLGLTPRVLAPADPARMGDTLSQWGRYYAQQPQVVFGEIPPAQRQLAQSPDAQAWWPGVA